MDTTSAPPDRRASGRSGGSASPVERAAARRRLHDKLARVDLGGIGLSAYNQRYLRHKVANLRRELQHVDDLLALCLAGSRVPLSEFVLVDYGGGSGLNSLLAKELGIGTVIYNDIYDVSCDDVARLSKSVGLTLDHIVCGDVDDVVRYAREHSLALDAVVSDDVLEHIYDVEAHFRMLATAPASPAFFRVVYASGANIKNPRYVRHASKVHATVELNGTTPGWGHKERDATRPFLEIRREMIQSAAPHLDAGEIEKLASATRGLRQDDLEKVVAEYVASGSISYRPDHPTNTCDPYTGNWAEHLIDPAWLERVVAAAGFSVRILAGRYAPGGSRANSALKRALNVPIAIFGRRALPLAPYYVVYASRRPSP